MTRMACNGVLFLVGAMVLGACNGPLIGKKKELDPPPPLAAPQNPDLEIKIAIEDDTLIRAQFVTLLVQYTNHGTSPILIKENGVALGGGVPGEIYEITHKGKVTRYTFYAVDTVPKHRRIGPGQTWTRKIENLRSHLSNKSLMVDGRALQAREPFPVPFTSKGEHTVQLYYSPVAAQKGDANAFRGLAKSNVASLTIR